MKLSSTLITKLSKHQRIDENEALELFQSDDLMLLGKTANEINQKKNDQVIGYVIDRNINYTNVCVLRCKFCAFRADLNADDSWEHTHSEVDEKIEELLKIGGTQILMQGGHHPKFKMDYYTNLISHIKNKYPQITIHAFSPPELHHISRLCKLEYHEVLRQLKDAGLDSIPGGGAEILDDGIRQELSAGKCNSQQWLDVFEAAHNLGIRGSATMMFGHIESLEQRVAHLKKLRDLQDRTEGFFAFIPWTFVPGNSKLDHEATGGYDYLRTLAICRIFLDNFKNIQISWLTQGLKMAQVAMEFGGNDMGSTLLEENVVRSTGGGNKTNVAEISRLIHEAGRTAKQRDTFYRYL